MDDKEEKRREWADLFFGRIRELQGSGLDYLEASGIADLENRIRQWPSDWGDDFHILIYGDFAPPSVEVTFESLGITIYPERQEKTIIRSATCVLKAKVKIHGKNIKSLMDAIRRINILLGAWNLIEWGSGASGWWSFVTHGSGGGARGKLEDAPLDKAINGLLELAWISQIG